MNEYSKFAWTATPLALVLLCVVLYIIFDMNFVRCDDNNKDKGCDAIDANMISRVENAEDHNMSNSRLNNIYTAANNLSDNLNTKNNQIANTQANVSKVEREIDCLKVAEVYTNQNAARASNTNCSATANTLENNNTPANTKKPPASQNSINANIKRLEIEKAQSSGELTTIITNANALTAEITKNTNTALAIRKQYAGRYSNRMLWIFLTALFIALSIAAVAAAAHVIFKSNRLFVLFIELKPKAERTSDEIKAVKAADKQTWIWLGITAAAAAIISIFIASNQEAFMSIVLPMLKQSLIKVKEISQGTLVAFTIIGFVGSVFLVAASCAIFRTAVEVNQKDKIPEKEIVVTPATATDAAVTKMVEDTDTKLKLYALLLKYLRTILYVGTFMLFVGILRMSFMMEWHLSFISTNTADDLYKLLSGFWKSSMTVQGGFYTILLAAIYLPAAYWINGKISQLGKTPAELTAEGVSDKYSDIIIKLLAIVSPLIASGFGGNTNWLNFFGS